MVGQGQTPMFSVEQLLKARQDGVPDYVVVPMLQKAMALQNAAKMQGQMQGGVQRPPIAQQVLQHAEQSHAKKLLDEADEHEAGIASLLGGARKDDEFEVPRHTSGGIMAFAEGGDTSYDPKQEVQARKSTYEDLLNDPDYAQEREGLAQSIKDKRTSIAEDKARAPWLSLMNAGIGMMSGTSPNAMVNIGKGLQAGADTYLGLQKEQSNAEDSLINLQSKLAQAKREEALAIMNHGYSSAEAKQAAAERNALEEKQLGLKTKDLEADKAYKQGMLGIYNQQADAATKNAETNATKAERVGATGSKLNTVDSTAYNTAQKALSAFERINGPIDDPDARNAWLVKEYNTQRSLRNLDPVNALPSGEGAESGMGGGNMVTGQDYMSSYNARLKKLGR